MEFCDNSRFIKLILLVPRNTSTKMDFKVAFIVFAFFFEVIQAEEHEHHNGIDEDTFHHHSETLKVSDVQSIIAAIEQLEQEIDSDVEENLRKTKQRMSFMRDAMDLLEQQIDLDAETQLRKNNKRIFFKSRKEVGTPDKWEAMRREKKRNAKLHPRKSLM